jgi:hypothetical protein
MNEEDSLPTQTQATDTPGPSANRVAPDRPRKRLAAGLGIIVLGVVATSLANQLLPHINLSKRVWEPLYLSPRMYPIGTDFRSGLFYPAKYLLEGKSPYDYYNSVYAPLAIVAGVPFRLLDVDRAYLAQVIVLCMLNVATLWLALKIASRVFDRPAPERGDWAADATTIAIFLAMAVVTFESYGFQFSIERGNFDIYTQLPALLGLWLLITRPRSLWLQVLCFSIAAHLKLYPTILFVLVVWRHGRRSVFPLVIVNSLLLLCTGPANTLQFIRVMVGYAQSPYVWIGNHSAASFGQMVDGYLIAHGWAPVPSLVFYVGPLVVWALGATAIWRRGVAPDRLVWLYILSVPLMALLPSTSHDYKLVLMSAPVAMTAYALVEGYRSGGKCLRLLQLAALMLLVLVLTRSYTMLPPVMGNKYPFILALEIVFVWIMLYPSPSLGRRSSLQSREAQTPVLVQQTPH